VQEFIYVFFPELVMSFSVSYPNMPWDLQVWRKSTPG